MAYGVRYRQEFYDRKGSKWKIDILQDGYTGAVIEVTGGSEPLNVHWLGEGEGLHNTVIGSEAEVQLMSTTDEQFFSMFTSAARDYQVKVYDSYDVLVWMGYVDPDSYREPYIDPPYPSVIHAHDGLGELKDREFDLDYMAPTYSKQLIQVIAEILDEMQFSLNIYVAHDIYPAAGSTTRPFEDIYVDIRTFQDGDGWMNAYDVLEQLLKPLGCRIFQYWGRWHIERIAKKYGATTSYDIYNSSAVYQSTTAIDTNRDLTNARAASPVVFVDRSQMLEIDPAVKSYRILQESEELGNILDCWKLDGSFYDTEFSSGSLINWSVSAGSFPYSHNTGDYYMSVGGGDAASASYMVSEWVDVTPPFISADNKMKFRVNIDTGLYALADEYKNYNSPTSNNVRFVIHVQYQNATVSGGLITNGGSTLDRYWLSTGWSATDTYGSYYYFEVEECDKKYEFEVDTDYLPVDKDYTGTTQVKIRIHNPLRDTMNPLTDFNWRVYAVRLSAFEEDLGTNYDVTVDIDSTNKKVLDDIETKYGDHLDLSNPEIFLKWQYQNSSGATVKSWTDGVITGDFHTLITWPDYTVNHNKPMRILSGVLYGPMLTAYALGPATTLNDSNNRKFVMTGGVWHAKRSMFEGEWRQIFDPNNPEFADYDADDFGTDFWRM